MAQKPLKDMSFKGYDKMSEEAGFVHHELMLSVIPLYEMIENKLNKDEINILIGMLDSKVDQKEFYAFQMLMQNKHDSIFSEFNETIIALSIKIDALKEAILISADNTDTTDHTQEIIDTIE